MNEVERMTAATEPSFVRVELDPANPGACLERVRRELQQPVDPPLVIDLHAVAYADPAILETLGEALQLARAMSRDVWIDGAAPGVYKALQIAKLGAFRRLQRSADVRPPEIDLLNLA
jgi:anti-anti-sigma regulatory factor